MLECLELRRAGDELRLELSHALYKEDAAMRVLARLTRERDEAREALASVKATLGPAFSSGAPAGDVEMETEPAAEEAGLPAEAKARVAETNKSCVTLSSLSASVELTCYIEQPLRYSQEAKARRGLRYSCRPQDLHSIRHCPFHARHQASRNLRSRPRQGWRGYRHWRVGRLVESSVNDR